MLEWKQAVGENTYVIRFNDGTSVPFRLLTYAEFKSYKSSFDVGIIPSELLYNYIYRTCVTDPFLRDHLDDLRAGIPDTVSKVIYYLSGPSSIEFVNDLLEAERNNIGNIDTQMKISICRVFSSYKMSDIDLLDFPSLIKLYTEAESVLLQMGALKEPMKIVPLEEVEKNKKRFSIEKAMEEARRLREI